MKSISKRTPEIKGEALEVPLSRVFENSWNYNRQDDDMYKKQLNSLEKFDLVQPIVVREIDEGFEIINGAHRYRAAQEVGMDTIAVWNLGRVSDTYAQQLTVVLNELKGRPDIDSLSHLLKNLDEQLGRTEIIENMPFSPQSIEDMINTLDFSWEHFEAEDDDIPATDGRKDMVRVEFRMGKEEAELLEEQITTMALYLKEDAKTNEGRTRVLLHLMQVGYNEVYEAFE